MSSSKKLTTLSLQEKLIHALTQIQKNAHMTEALQPTINALKTKLKIPEGDYKNISLLKDVIFNYHTKKLNADPKLKNVPLKHTHSLLHLAQQQDNQPKMIANSKKQK